MLAMRGPALWRDGTPTTQPARLARGRRPSPV